MKDVILIGILAAGICVIVSVVCAILVARANRERDEAKQEVADAKTEFLSRVSNEIKTPMNVIIGTVTLGMEESGDPEKVRQRLQEIDAAGRVLMTMIGDLVDASKIEMGRFRLHPKSYAFQDFLDVMRGMMESMCEKKKIHFVMPEVDININIMADPLRFEQLFVNLLTNAVKFTPEGGTVSFRVCNYGIHNNRFAADYIIADTGIGMSKEFQDVLFEPFTQEISTKAEKHNGAGLGLAIVHNITEQMGGTIEVESGTGCGTTVKVRLDVELAEVQPEKKIEFLSEDEILRILGGKRVLLVEDHPMNIEVARHILEKQHMEVVCAENGKVALDLYMEHEPGCFDAVLMDVYMPVMDGLEASRQIRKTKQADARVIPIIAMSASDSYEDIVACKEAGMDAHIAKPVEPQKLYQVLCEYLEALE